MQIIEHTDTGNGEKLVFRLVQTVQDLKTVREDVLDSKLYAVDTEAWNPNPYHQEMNKDDWNFSWWDHNYQVLGVSVATKTTEGYYIPLNHRLPTQRRLDFDGIGSIQVTESEFVSIFRDVLETKPCIGHNISSFDANVFGTLGIKVRIGMDTLNAYRVLPQPRYHSYKLENLVKQLFGREAPRYKQVLKQEQENDFAKVPLNVAAVYAGYDAINTLLLGKRALSLFARPDHKTASDVYWKIEHPLETIVPRIQEAGLRIDVDAVTALHDSILCIEEEIEEQFTDFLKANVPQYYIAASKGDPAWRFRPSSSDDLKNLFFDTLMLPTMNKDGSMKTDKDWIEKILKLDSLHDLAKGAVTLLARWRAQSKVRSTYTKSLIALTDTKGIIHPSYKQTHPESGRISQERPTGQTLPREVKTINDYGDPAYDVRKTWIPTDDDHIYARSDYKTMEVILTAWLSQDPRLMGIYTHHLLFDSETEEIVDFGSDGPRLLETNPRYKEVDVHRYTASDIYGKPYRLVTKDERTDTKPVVFGSIYGITANGLAPQIRKPVKVAAIFLDKFFTSYVGVKSLMNELSEFILKHGYVETVFGYRRYSKIKPDGSESTRQAMLKQGIVRELSNTAIQGAGANIVKIVMYILQQALEAGEITDEFVEKYRTITINGTTLELPFLRPMVGIKGTICMQVHDELIVQAHKSSAARVLEAMRIIMTVRLTRPGWESIVLPVDGELANSASKDDPYVEM